MVRCVSEPQIRRPVFAGVERTHRPDNWFMYAPRVVGPEAEGGVGAPGAPGLGAVDGFGWGCAAECLADAEVGCGERVGVAQSQREVLRRPRPDARQRAQLLFEHARAGPSRRARACRRRRPARSRALRSLAGSASGARRRRARREREAVPETERLEAGHRCAELGDDLAHRRGRTGDADLLADDRAHAGFEGVPTTRDAQRLRPRRQHLVSLEHRGDGLRVGVEIEHASHAPDVVDETFPAGEVEAGDQVVVGAAHFECSRQAVDLDRSAVDAAREWTRRRGSPVPTGRRAGRPSPTADGT